MKSATSFLCLDLDQIARFKERGRQVNRAEMEQLPGAERYARNGFRYGVPVLYSSFGRWDASYSGLVTWDRPEGDRLYKLLPECWRHVRPFYPPCKDNAVLIRAGERHSFQFGGGNCGWEDAADCDEAVLCVAGEEDVAYVLGTPLE